MTPDKIEFVSVLRMVLGGPVPNDTDLGGQMSEALDDLDEPPTIPLDSDHSFTHTLSNSLTNALPTADPSDSDTILASKGGGTAMLDR